MHVMVGHDHIYLEALLLNTPSSYYGILPSNTYITKGGSGSKEEGFTGQGGRF